MLDVLREAIADETCGSDWCEAWTSRGHALVLFGVEAGRWVVRALMEDAPGAGARAGGAPRAMTAARAPSVIEPVVRERTRSIEAIVGEAPLRADGSATAGTIGVAVTDLEFAGPSIAVVDGAYARIFPLSSMSLVRGEVPDARYEARFADVDGDGRTDVVLRMSGRASEGTPIAFTQVFAAPPPSTQSARLTPEMGSALAVLDAPSVDAAVQAALAVATRGTTRDEACRLLGSATSVAGFRRVATADARVLAFEEPRMPTWRAKVKPLAKLAAEDVRGMSAHCAELECSATRPYCTYAEGPYSEHYWFAWDAQGQMHIAGAALYAGE
jgi:hypothetical protein